MLHDVIESFTWHRHCVNVRWISVSEKAKLIRLKILWIYEKKLLKTMLFFIYSPETWDARKHTCRILLSFLSARVLFKKISLRLFNESIEFGNFLVQFINEYISLTITGRLIDFIKNKSTVDFVAQSRTQFTYHLWEINYLRFLVYISRHNHS